MFNEWKFSGEVVKIREHISYDVGATVTVRGVSQRVNNDTANIVEFPLILQTDLWMDLVDEGIKPYSVIEAKGHFESWVNANDNNYRVKLKHFVDSVKILKV